MARVLITGGAGFIGSHLAEAFVEEGAQVRVFDNLSTGTIENVSSIRDRIEFLHGDILDLRALIRASRDVDYVFHEAAVPSVMESIAHPLDTDGPNLRGTLNTLEAARQNGVRRYVFAASAAAYGNDLLSLPKTEEMPLSPVSPYAVQKVASELYLQSYKQVFGLQTVALRYFNVFGPRQSVSSQYSGVLTKFIVAMNEGTTPTIFGNGESSRDFVHVDDVVHANLLAAKAPDHVSGEIYNIATGRRVTINEAYRIIKKSTRYQGDVQYEAERVGDIRHSVANISKARQYLGYNPAISLEDGLAKMLGVKAWDYP